MRLVIAFNSVHRRDFVKNRTTICQRPPSSQKALNLFDIWTNLTQKIEIPQITVLSYVFKLVSVLLAENKNSIFSTLYVAVFRSIFPTIHC